MNKGFVIAMVFTVWVWSCSTSAKDRLIGKWKVVNCDFKGKGKSGGLYQDYYNFYLGNVLIYDKDSARWDTGKKAFPYYFNEKTSEIVYQRETIKVLNLTPDSLVVMETDTNGTLVTSFARIN